MTPQELEALLLKLDAWIQEHQPEALKRFERFSRSSSVHVLHAHIGKNNNVFVDSVRTQFQSPGDFIARWIHGLNEKLSQLRAAGRKGYNGRPLSEEMVLMCLQDDLLGPYTIKFLERNFYRNFRERIRAKPNDDLWSIWFGAGNLVWGVVIAPARRNEEWTNDKSQMRRETYNYWTVGHILATGLIDPTSDKPVRFGSLKEFCVFYRSVLKRVSNSLYEQGICDRYLDYLLRSGNPIEEPLLVPELRYLGKEKRHEYRLDFTVLNSHTSRFVGFEFSPASTHINITGAKAKTQVAINEELAGAWEKEMAKRTAYFEKFGIQTITFTDRDLKNLDQCFDQIARQLRDRHQVVGTVASALESLMTTHASGLTQPSS
jgi:hypothetical protein